MRHKLRLEDLEVTSFETAEDASGRGTVFGRLYVEPGTFAVNDMCTAGCTEYCETDGGGRGYTCDIRCWSRQNCESEWQCGPAATYFNEPSCDPYACQSDINMNTCGGGCTYYCTPGNSGCPS